MGRHVGVAHGEAAHVQLVDQHVVPGHARRPIVAPDEGGVHHLTLGHPWRAVAGVEAEILGATADPIAKLGIAPMNLADDAFGVGIEQQLVSVEAVALLRPVGAMHPVTVQQIGPGFRQIGVPDSAGALAQRDLCDLVLALGVEQAQHHLFGVLRKQSEVDALSVPGRPKRIRPARPDGHGGLHYRRPIETGIRRQAQTRRLTPIPDYSLKDRIAEVTSPGPTTVMPLSVT